MHVTMHREDFSSLFTRAWESTFIAQNQLIQDRPEIPKTTLSNIP